MSRRSESSVCAVCGRASCNAGAASRLTGTSLKRCSDRGAVPLEMAALLRFAIGKVASERSTPRVFYPKIALGYTQIATISTDDHHTLQEFRAAVGAQWIFLSDSVMTHRYTCSSNIVWS
jgi:hypothetical protein